jgi:hypothetical protein
LCMSLPRLKKIAASLFNVSGARLPKMVQLLVIINLEIKIGEPRLRTGLIFKSIG